MALISEALKDHPGSSTRVTRVAKRAWLPIAKLEILPSAQRTLVSKWVTAQVDRFDPEALGFPVVNRTSDGHLYIIDGQHRIALLRAVGWGDQSVECEVYDGLTPKEMAEEFLIRNTKINVKTFDKFRIAVTAGNPEACAIVRVVEACGLRVGLGSSLVQCVAALKYLFHGGGLDIANTKRCEQAISRALETIVVAWGATPASLNGSIVEGVGLMYLRYGDTIDSAALAKRLAPTPGGPSGVLGRARSLREVHGGSVGSCVASTLVDLYNRGRQSGKLDRWWK